MPHDFNKFPELTNSQMDLYYWESPHKQITSSFTARVVKVHDGDSVTLRWDERDFDFPLRISNISARELHETEERDTSFQMSADGEESQKWLEGELLGEEVYIQIDPNNRIEKFGRILGKIIHNGLDVGELSIKKGQSVPWENRNDFKLQNLEKMIGVF